MSRRRIHPEDLTGMTFGRLTVLGKAPQVRKYVQWHCRCSCGKETYTAKTEDLLQGHTKSCGCLYQEFIARVKIPIEPGQRFHSLVAIEPVLPVHRHRTWLTKCDCGKERVARVSDLAAGITKHCGCKWRFSHEMRRENLAGQRFGRLVVLEYIGVRSARSLWRCTCDCGNETEAMSHNLKFGRTGSCGKCPRGKTKPSASPSPAPGNTA